jgi:exonuclease SbcC
VIRSRREDDLIRTRMRLELVNFRCWKKKTFDFPDEGLVLLSGGSGGGKTSILSSIYFVLYGTGTKIITFGEKKCSVRLLYKDLDITRTKGPNRLLLLSSDTEYEDDVAQGIITKKFGTNFTLTSYITQKTVQSFLHLGPSDKMNFLEQLALGEEDISGIKKKAREKVREKREDLNKNVGRLELLTGELDGMVAPTEVRFPIGDKNKHSDVKIKNEEIFWKRTVKDLAVTRETLRVLEIDSSREDVKRAIRNGKETDLTGFSDEKDKLEIESSKIEDTDSIDDLKSTLLFLKNKKDFSSLSDSLVEERRRYDESYKHEMGLLVEEETLLKKERDSILVSEFSDESSKMIDEDILQAESILSITEEMSGYKKTRSKYKDYDRDEKVRSLEMRIEELQSEISETERRVDIKCCPSCKVSLRFSQACLVLADGDPVDEKRSKDEIRTMRIEIAECKNLSQSIKKEIAAILYIEKETCECRIRLDEKTKRRDIPSGLSECREYLESRRLVRLEIRRSRENMKNILNNIERVSSKIKNEIFSSTLKNLKTGLETKTRELEKIKEELDEDIETDYTEDELREEISKMEILSFQKRSLEKRISRLEVSIRDYKKEIEKIVVSDRDFTLERREIADRIRDYEIKEREHERISLEIRRYSEYKKERDIYNNRKDKMDKSKLLEEESKRELSYCDIFLRKIQEAESLSIGRTIDDINFNMNYYLERFFPDNPITVIISPYKETKKDIKPSINIVVGYKGLETSLDSLSGGEYDRVVLSLLLSLNSMFGSDILMLDESISSLDGELTNEILEVLKETVGEKLVIVVAHQISVGVFDRVVSVD